MATDQIAGAQVYPALGAPPAATAEPRRGMQRAGGITALLFALGFPASFALTFFAPSLGVDDNMPHEPARFVAFIAQHYAVFVALTIAQLLISLLLLPTMRALEERLRGAAPSLAPLATVIGYIGAGVFTLAYLSNVTLVAELRTHTLEQVAAQQWTNHLLGDLSIAGYAALVGMWTLLVSWIGARRGALPRLVSYGGLLVGALDLLVLLGVPAGPMLTPLWFLALGIALLRGDAGAGRRA